MTAAGPRRRLAAGWLLVLATCAALAPTPPLDRLERATLDVQFRTLRALAGAQPPGEIAIVGIDEATIAALPEPLALWHPHLGALLAALAAARPALVGLDLILPERSYDFIAPGSDRALLAGMLAMRGAAPLVVARTVDERGRLRPLFAPVVSVAGEDALGLALVPADPDGVVRRVQARAALDGGGEITTFAGRAAAALGAPLRDGLIDYSIGGALDYVPLADVLAWQRDGRADEIAGHFRDRIVLVGAVLPFTDRHAVPVPLAAREPGNRSVPGVLVHAQALRTARRGTVQPVAPALRWLAIAVASGLWWLRGVRAVVALGLGAAVALGASTAALAAGWWAPVAGACLTACAALAARAAHDGIAGLRERMRLRRSFSRYVSPDVLTEILAGRLRPDSLGERRHVCVLFSDIRDFTSRSESQPPEAIIGLLNDYFEEMTASVHRHGGTVDKFIGDGLMVFFGAPGPRDAPERDAFDAARDMLARLERLNARLAAGGVEPVAIGIGLHAGEAVVGHVGSSQRHEYTVIGDTVNTASRLEGLTKSLGYPLVCSPTVADAVGDAGLHDLGEQAVKGRAAVRVFGWRPAAEHEAPSPGGRP